METTASVKKRIDMVDALRGFALFGIILAHMNEQFYAGMPAPCHERMGIKSGVDTVLQTLSEILISGKFFTIFSFLFGLSFGIQMLNAKEKGEHFLGRFSWRLIILFLIGFLNHIHYRGDILVIYAVLGFFLLLFHKASNKALLIWALFFILNMPGLIFKTVSYVQDFGKPATANSQPAGIPEGFDMKKMQAYAATYYTMLKQGDYKGIVKANITNEFQNKLAFQIFSGRLFVTMGLFILGLYVARKGIFQNLQAHDAAVKKWLQYAGVFCIVMLIIYFSLGEKIFQTGGLLSMVLSFLGEAFSPALSVVYVTGFLLLYQKAGWQKRLSALVPMGRMGLTTYLSQTIFGILIFYGYGLNLMDVIGNSTAFGIGIVIFIAQLFFSRWWMQHFYYGPVEWLWRSLTYMKMQPFKK